MGDSQTDALRVDFDRHLKLEFHGSTVTSSVHTMRMVLLGYCRGWVMEAARTTAAVLRYLDDLAGDAPAESVVHALLDRAVRRPHFRLGDLGPDDTAPA